MVIMIKADCVIIKYYRNMSHQSVVQIITKYTKCSCYRTLIYLY